MGLQGVGHDWATENYFYLVCKCLVSQWEWAACCSGPETCTLFGVSWCFLLSSEVAELVKNPPAMQETLVWFLGSGRSAGEGTGYPLQDCWTFLMAQMVKNPLQGGRPRFDPWARKIPWRRERLPTSVFWYGEFHGIAKSRTWLSNFHFHMPCPEVFPWHPGCLDAPRP